MMELDVKTNFAPLKAMEKAMPEAKRRALEAAGKVMHEAIRREAPVDTGDLRGSIRLEVKDGKLAVVSAGEGLDDRRAVATQLESNWMGRALFGAQGRITRAYAQELWRVLESATAQHAPAPRRIT